MSTGSLPSTYKAAVFKAKNEPLTIESLPLQQPCEGEILVKVEACAVCRGDHVAQAGILGDRFPIVPGHEIIGNVAMVPAGEKKWKVGDRVGGPWHGGHDGTCKACKKGMFQMCENAVTNGITRNGGYAEYCIFRTEAAVPIPDDVDAATYAPILCAGVTVFNSMRRLRVPPGELVAVQGLGGLGHLAIQYANKFGYRVVALSSSGEKENFARELGAHEYIDGSKVDEGEELKKLGGAAMIVATAPNPISMSGLVKGLGIEGKLLVLAPVGDLAIDTIALVQRGLSVHGFPSGHSIDCEEAIEFTQTQRIKCLVEKFSLDNANDAYDAMMNRTVRFRSVIMM